MSQLFVVKLVGFAVVLICLSLYCIYRNQRKISFLIEFLILALMGTFVALPEIKENYVNLLTILVVFLLAKVVILAIVKLLEIRSFYWAKDIAQGKAEKYYKRYNKKRFLKFVSNIRKIEYGPRLKYGVPAMANKTEKKTNTRFDDKGFPKFKNVFFEMKLNWKDINKSRDVHFNRASKALYEKTQKDKRFAKKFTKQELEIFKKGKVPSKFTWHHHQERGRMQLVLTEIHSKVSHKGGFSIWGKKEKSN